MDLNKIIKFIFLYMLITLSLLTLILVELNMYLMDKVHPHVLLFINYFTCFLVLLGALKYFRKSDKDKN